MITSETMINDEIDRINREIEHIMWVRDKFGITQEALEGLMYRDGVIAGLSWVLTAPQPMEPIRAIAPMS